MHCVGMLGFQPNTQPVVQITLIRCDPRAVTKVFHYLRQSSQDFLALDNQLINATFCETTFGIFFLITSGRRGRKEEEETLRGHSRQKQTVVVVVGGGVVGIECIHPHHLAKHQSK